MSTQRSSKRPKRPHERSGSEPFLLAELLGFLAAVAIAAINLVPKPDFAFIWPGAVTLLLILLCVGTLIIAAPLALLTLLVSDRLPADTARLFGSRLGFRSSAAYLLTAFGLISAEQLLHAAGWSSSLLEALPPIRVFAVIAMVAMPVLALGSLSTSLCMWGVFSLRATEPLDALAPEPPSKPQVSVFPLIAVIALLGLASMSVSPDLLRRDRGADEAPVAPAPDPTETAEPAPALFIYERPVGLDFATPAEWKITATKTLGTNFNRPVLDASPDGKLLAVAHLDRGGEIEIFDLTTATLTTKFAPSTNPTKNFTWSPDSGRIFIIDTANQVAVLDLDPHSITPLPLPESEHIPEYGVVWWQEREIAFHDESNKLLAWLDLDTLALQSVSVSPFWRTHHKPSGDASKDSPPLLPERFIEDPVLRETSRCRLTLAPAFTSYRAPSVIRSEWKVGWTPHLVIRDRLQPRSVAVADMHALDGDLYHIADDCTKLVRVRNATAEIFYFGTNDQPAPVTFEIPLLESLSSSTTHPEFTEAMKTHSVCVWICPHVVNPLNERAVGPDRNHPKAIARIVSWKDHKATFTLAHTFEPLAATDVLCDPHIWRDGHPHAIASPFPTSWWRQLPYASQTTPATSSTNSSNTEDNPKSDVPDNLTELDMRQSLNLEPNRDAFVFRSIRFPEVRPPTPAPEPDPLPAPPSPLAATPDPIPQPEPPAPKPAPAVAQEPPPAPDPVRVIEIFLRQHHRDLCGRSIPNLVENYSAQIIDASMPHAVDRAMMQRNFSTPGMGWPESIELLTPMTVGRLREYADRYKAQYTMRITDEGKAYRYFVQIFLVLTSEGPKIYSEQNTLIPADRR